jgi:hypothetical protein
LENFRDIFLKKKIRKNFLAYMTAGSSDAEFGKRIWPEVLEIHHANFTFDNVRRSTTPTSIPIAVVVSTARSGGVPYGTK